MLRLKIVYTDEAGKKANLKVKCPFCAMIWSKEAFFSDLWGQYPVKCQMCGGDFAPIYHLISKKAVRVLWHRNNGLVKPKLGGQMWAPLNEVVAKTEEGKESNHVETVNEWLHKHR
jgi:hypothetical protein